MFVVLPNQLFEKLPPVRSHTPIYLVEEPLYFYDHERRPILPNKIKIAYMVACMYEYKDYLSKHLRNTIHYVKYDDIPSFYKKVKKAASITMYDPTDHDVITKYQSLQMYIQVLPTPMFLLSLPQLAAFHKGRHNTNHATFYKYVQDILQILPGVASTDKENRTPIPKTKNIPSFTQTFVHTHYTKASRYVQTHSIFKTAVGSTEHLTMWPITYKDARHALQTFIRHRLETFGPYQDAIHKDYIVLYHAAISPMLNMGLLDPREVVHAVLEKRTTLPMQSIEGFIRQVIGWREYMRSLYIHHTSLSTSNHFRHHRTFKDWDAWTTGITGILPIDEEIKKAVSFGYSHHIVRLMMFLNIFQLMEICPQDVHRWFMQVVSMDAFDWVMKSNIYAMGWYYPNAMTKPYLSSSNYIRRMSNYAHGEWCDIWDALFYRFIHRHRNDLHKGARVYLRNLGAWRSKPRDEKARLLRIANTFIEQHTLATTPLV